jgi:hypothetical protein
MDVWVAMPIQSMMHRHGLSSLLNTLNIKGKLFNHIKAHSKLSPANARDLMQWIIDGAQ